MWNFLSYFNTFLISAAKSKKLPIKLKLLENSFFFIIEEISLFSHLEERFIKNRNKVFVEIKFMNDGGVKKVLKTIFKLTKGFFY